MKILNLNFIGGKMFKGEATILVNEGDKIVSKITKTNIITKRTTERLFNSNAQVFNDACKIVLSSDTPSVDYERTTLNNCLAIGNDTLSGVAGRVYLEETETEPRQVSYHNRFIFPSASRTIGSIAIIPSGTINNNLGNTTEDIYCYLTLDTPITQEINQILNVFYRVYIDWSGNTFNGINPEIQDGLSQLMLAVPEANGIIYGANRLSSTILKRSDDDWDKLPNTNPEKTSGSDYSTTTNHNGQLFKRQYSCTGNINSKLNSHIFGIATGRVSNQISSTRRDETFKTTNGTSFIDTPISLTPVYSHAANANTFFYDANTLSTSDWKPLVTTDNTNDGLPTLYSLQVETGGGLGVGSYSVWTTNYSGNPYDNLFWVQYPTPLVETSLYPYLIKKDRDRALPINDKWFYDWKSDRLWVSGDGQKVGLWQFYPEFLLVDEWDLGADINDMATNPDADRIYVATESGLIEIDTLNDTTTTLNPDPAKAVDVGYNGAVFCAFSDRLSSSLNADWTIAEDVTGMGITDWANVVFIRCDRDAANHNLGIMEYRYNPQNNLPSPTNFNNQWVCRIHFWSKITGFENTIDCTVDGSNSITRHVTMTHPFSSSFICDQGIWIYPLRFHDGGYFLYNLAPGLNVSLLRKIKEDPLYGGVTENYQGDIYVDTSTNVRAPDDYVLGATQFGNILRSPTDYNLNYGLSRVFPSFALLSYDLSYLRIAASGRNGVNSVSSNYTSSIFNRGVGFFDFAYDDQNPNNATLIRNYRNAGGHIYNYTAYSYGSVQEALLSLTGNVRKLKSGGVINLSTDRIARTASGEKYTRRRRLPGDSGAENYYYTPIVISTCGAPRIGDRLRSDFSVRYGWDDVAGEWVKSDVLPGKPLHTASEPLINGLSLAWQDLNPGQTADLVPGEYYTWVDMNGSGVANDGSLGGFTANWSYTLRPVAKDVALSGAIASNTYTIPEATSDAYWLCLDFTDLSTIEIAIAGYGTNATIINSGLPNANEVLLVNSVTGELQFNAIDDGKNITGTFLYMKKYHPTEIL